MLNLTRCIGEWVRIETPDGNVVDIVVRKIGTARVALVFNATRDARITRGELIEDEFPEHQYRPARDALFKDRS